MAVRHLGCLAVAVGLVAGALPASSLVWRDDLTDQQMRDLSKQGQFAGVGSVTGGGTAVAIAPGWVLTARHVVGNGNTDTFFLNGSSYSGTSISRPESDVALLQLFNNQQLPSSTIFIAPNPTNNALNQLVWKVGRGGASSASNTANLSPSGIMRAGTNIVNSQQNVGLGGGNATGPNSHVFNQSNTSANSTVFEVTTAPGDSGGPMFYQHNNQWFIAGTTFGAVGGVGFIDANVTDVYQWIRDTTGETFTPQAAPTEIFWDGDASTEGVQTGPGRWHTQRPTFTANGFNYTWENDFAPTAVFGTASTGAALLQVDDQITVGGIRFDPLIATSGPFQLLDDGGTLAAKSGGATIESNAFARIQASLAGNNNFTKAGNAALQLDGDNSQFNGQLFINDGTLRTNIAEAFGTGGFLGNTKTTVTNGATIQLTVVNGGASSGGITTGEHFHLSGAGDNGNGALFVSSGQHTFTERIALQDDTTIRIDANASATFGGGAQGRFYNPATADPRTLTKIGGGVAVFDLVNNIGGLVVSEGVVVGNGGISGTVIVNNNAEIRPGDSATATSVGTFTTGDLTLDPGSLLTIDLDPTASTGDRLIVNGTVTLGGALAITLASAPQLGDSFLILDNDGIDPTLGLFSNGLTVSAMLAGQTYNFAINTFAGTGNDVSLTSIPVPEPATAVMLVMLSHLLPRRRR